VGSLVRGYDRIDLVAGTGPDGRTYGRGADRYARRRLRNDPFVAAPWIAGVAPRLSDDTTLPAPMRSGRDDAVQCLNYDRRQEGS
jgi:hypothetical protein